MPKRYSSLNIFTSEGRISRVPYTIFSILIPITVFWILAAIAGILAKLGNFGESLAYALFLFAIISAAAVLIILTIQRSHDFNTSGWLSVLVLLLPPMIILFWLMPGTRGINSYGETSAPLLKWFTWLSLAFAIILLIISIVAYINY